MAFNQNDPPINFNFKQYNESPTALRKMEYAETFNQALLQNPDRHKVAVTRLKIPTAALETFIMDNNADFAVTLSGGSVFHLADGASYTNIMPAEDAIDDFGCCNGLDMKYYSSEQVVDTISRIMYRSYADWTNSNGSLAVIYSTITINNATTATSTFTVSSTHANVADIRVILKKIKVSGSPIDGGGVFTRKNIPIRVWIQAPGTTDKVYIHCHAGYHNWDPSCDTLNYELHFTERAFGSFPDYYNPAANKSLKLNVLPHETFLTMHGLSANGSWTIGVDSDLAFYGSVEYSVRIGGVLASAPYLPASLSIDDTTKKFKFTYQAKMAQSALKWSFAPKLHYMLNMGANRSKLNRAGTKYYIEYPPLSQTYIGSELLSFDQEQSSEYLLINISRIIVRSNSLSTEAEYGANMNFDNVITDFMIDSADTTNPGTLIFSESAGVYPWRTYKILTSTAMSRLDLHVSAEYSNNIVRDIFIPPGLSGMARISFFPL